MDSCPENKPCHATVYGSFLIAFWLYTAAFLPEFLDVSFNVAVGKLFAGNVIELLWFALLLSGIALLFIGMRAARSHDDPTDWSRVFFSALLACICVFAVCDQWFFTDSALAWHACRAFWLSLLAGAVADIWLETRGFFGRRDEGDYPVSEPVRYSPVEQYRSQRWRRQTEWIEETIHVRQTEAYEATEWQGEPGAFDIPALAQPAPWDALPEIGTPLALLSAPAARPQIVYVKQGDSFIPVRLPDAPRVIEHRS